MAGVSPPVSVLIPTYDYAGYLPEAIESVRSQKFDGFEIVIVDDASRDDTRHVLERYSRRDPRIRWEINPRNLGLVANWNKCLSLARGKFVKFVFADDLLLSDDALSLMVDRLESDPSISLVASSRKVIDARSEKLDVWSHWPDGAVLEGPGVIRRCLMEGRNYIGEPSAVMFRREQAARGFDERYLQIVDLEMWFHLLGKGRFSYIDRPICAFRRHPLQQTEKARRGNLDLLDEQLLLEEYLGEPRLGFSASERWFLKYRNVRLSRRRLRNAEAGQAVGKELLRRYGRARYFLGYPAYKICKGYFRRIADPDGSPA